MKEQIKGSLLSYMVASNSSYLPTKLHRFICNLVQSEVERGGARIAITLPPRHGKSEIVSKGLPAFYLGHNPTAEVMEICHSSDLATEFGGDVRAMMSSPFYAALFPDSVATGQGTSGQKWRTVSGGKYKGEGIDGSFTGFGANLLIVDDIVKNRKQAHSPTFQKGTKDTFGSTIFTRLLPDSNVIILNTRWSASDLVGYVGGELGWRIINLPAIALDGVEDPLGRSPGEALCPERYPLEALMEIKATLNPYDWLALYQGQPPDEVKVTEFGTTPLGTLPKVAVWHSDRVLLFADNACTDMGAAETLSELKDWLDSKGASKIPVYTAETGTANHPHVREVLPNLRYHPDLDGYLPTVTCTYPQGARVSPKDIQVTRYYMTIPKVTEYQPGRLALGMMTERPQVSPIHYR